MPKKKKSSLLLKKRLAWRTAPLAMVAVLAITAGYIVVSTHAATTSAAFCAPSTPMAATPDAIYNQYFTRSGPGWTGGDAGYSTKLPDGRIAWDFSDTLLGTVNPDRSRPSFPPFINNSLMAQKGSTFTTITGGTASAPKSLIPSSPAGTWYWVSANFVENGQMLVFLNQFKSANNGTTGLNFAPTGQMAVATFKLPGLTLSSVKTLVTNDTTTTWGNATYAGTTYRYIYGLESVGSSRYMHVARVPLGHTLTTAWQYYTGSGWSSKRSASARITNYETDGIAKYGTGYAMFSIPPFSNQLNVSYSCSLTGPWSTPTSLYTIPEVGYGIIAYIPTVHPELTANGQLLVEYNINSLNDGDLVRNADTYRPKFLRVGPKTSSPAPAGSRILPQSPSSR